MSKRIVTSLVLVIGLGIGGIVPAAMAWWYNVHHVSSTLNSINPEDAVMNDTSAKVTYHFVLNQGVLSVIEGPPGTSGKVVVTGLNVQAWPKDMLDIAPKVEFYSFDEVQSFIDTVNEPLWQE
ncbi:MAG: hypothetical protein P4L49_13105 [Desulfosporosinus sp.]|nr:hypothetical protein [Desulfosporosinus sp.]